MKQIPVLHAYSVVPHFTLLKTALILWFSVQTSIARAKLSTVTN